MVGCCKYCNRARRNERWSIIEVDGIGVRIFACHKHKKMLETIIRTFELRPRRKGAKLDDFN